MADAFVQVLLDNLNSLIRKELGLILGVDSEMKRLSSLLSTIQAVLEDAEEKQVKDRAIQNWLRKLKHAAYKVDDILDECATEASRLESQSQSEGLMNKVKKNLLSRFSPCRILFSRKIANRMRDVREKLDEIAGERIKFHLKEGVAERRAEVVDGRQTGSIVTQPRVYGRDEDKERIVEYLVNHVACCDEISIYPIVGMGGLGKTTLAQMVFNDERVKTHFELRIWVCISQDFSLRRVIRSIFESATGTACEALDLDPLQRRLQDILSGKRYFLVLDDVWNEDEEKWDRLKYVLACGSRSASIIVTTRIKKVAWIMGTVPLHNLSNLEEDDCWSLFRERAFGSENEERPNLVAIGKEIVKKCGGVPLAVKSLGSLMRYKNVEKEWLSVKESELWNLPQTENSILPALRLSFSNLPSELRPCFAYCAIFPKDFVIQRRDLVHLWMANGFIQSSGKLEPEDVGNEICNELYWRSFFQDAGADRFGEIDRFKMHGLLHDLAQSIMEHECCFVEAESTDSIPKRIFHISVITKGPQSYSIPEDLHRVEALRTLLVQHMFSRTYPVRNVEFSCDFSRLSSLRAFGARSTTLVRLSSSVRHLKHLRYLDLSRTLIQVLPESICKLLNLQTLKLEYCFLLKKLPKHLSHLKNLRHLYLFSCSSLSEMPPKIGKITRLKTLTIFIVGQGRGRHLDELEGLDLVGELQIKHLDRVVNPMDARQAKLCEKQNLRRLYLSWRGNSYLEQILSEKQEREFEQPGNVEEVLEALEPTPNLESLVIEEYPGDRFPLWVRGEILDGLVDLELSNCKNCSELPPLGQLPSLRNLEIGGMNCLLYLEHEIQVGGTTRGFPSLVSLIIRDLPNLQRLSRNDEPLLPCLTSLIIINCPNLSLPYLPSVKDLTVRGCSEVFLRSISNLGSLIHLSIDDNNESVNIPHGMLQNLTSLRSLSIQNFCKLKVLPTELASLGDLESLYIGNCHELESFPEEGLNGLKSLRHLNLYSCRKFGSLSEGLQQLTALEKLILDGCPELVAFPDGTKHLRSLQHLSISGRPTAMDGSSGRKPTGLYNLMYRSDMPGESIYRSKLIALPESLRHVPALESLCISCYPDLASLPHWLGDLTSLYSLQIFSCPMLSTFPESMHSLTKLQNLHITQCPELVKRCRKETGQDWYKIAHVPNVYMES